MDKEIDWDLGPCEACDRRRPLGFDSVCRECLNRLGPVLAKSLTDTFDYAVLLRNGTLVRFEYAAVATSGSPPDWIVLQTADESGFSDLNPPCPRGMAVRIDEILWATDAPDGS